MYMLPGVGSRGLEFSHSDQVFRVSGAIGAMGRVGAYGEGAIGIVDTDCIICSGTAAVGGELRSGRYPLSDED